MARIRTKQTVATLANAELRLAALPPLTSQGLRAQSTGQAQEGLLVLTAPLEAAG